MESLHAGRLGKKSRRTSQKYGRMVPACPWNRGTRPRREFYPVMHLTVGVFEICDGKTWREQYSTPLKGGLLFRRPNLAIFNEMFRMRQKITPSAFASLLMGYFS